MSETGQTETSARPPGMSGLPPIADIVRLRAQVRSVPEADNFALVPLAFTPHVPRGHNAPFSKAERIPFANQMHDCSLRAP
jgi:hypothetical protein